MKKLYLIFLLCFFATISVDARSKKVDREIKRSLFVPKGYFMGGCSFSYNEQNMDNFKFMILKNIDVKGYTFKVSPYFGYFFKDNIAAGGRFHYGRSYLNIDNLNVKLSDDLSFDIKNFNYLEHSISGAGFLRTYMGIGNSKIFGFFNELRLAYSYGQAKMTSGIGKEFTGTHQVSHNIKIGSAPGLSAFVTNNLAVEVLIPIIGLDFAWQNQKTDQVESGYRRKSSADFKINLFGLDIGLSYYF